ncbi:GerAB/ArcD/ProY family transporter [Gracilibacillus lacisalsi]|uniref:GerAB/ArcD/ProY family transporter n=1 Tax=Gracilibacillus lacisalsi TaxID=393087 RepID=UPI0003647C3E|nr:endospore germination permease [Gracilibacillus lacisalsi]
MIEKLNGQQFGILVIMNTLGASIIYIPNVAASFGKENGWITIILATIIGLILITLYSKLIKLQYDQGIFHTFNTLFGKWVGTVVTIFLILFLLINCSANLWAIGDFISLQILMGTPFEVILIVLMGTSLIAIKYGIEVIGRTASIFFPFTIFSILLLTVLVIKDASMNNIQPIFQVNRLGTIVGTIPIVAITFMELFILLGITHTINNKKSTTKSLFYGGITSGVLLLTITFTCITVLGVESTANYMYPIYALGQRISIFDFFERVEVIVAFIWFFTIFFKICTSFYVLALGISHLLNMKNYNTLSTPLALFIFLFSMLIVPNTFGAFDFIYGPYIIYCVLLGVVLPVAMLMAHFLKNNLLKTP